MPYILRNIIFFAAIFFFSSMTDSDATNVNVSIYVEELMCHVLRPSSLWKWRCPFCVTFCLILHIEVKAKPFPRPRARKQFIRSHNIWRSRWGVTVITKNCKTICQIRLTVIFGSWRLNINFLYDDKRNRLNSINHV